MRMEIIRSQTDINKIIVTISKNRAIELPHCHHPKLYLKYKCRIEVISKLWKNRLLVGEFESIKYSNNSLLTSKGIV